MKSLDSRSQQNSMTDTQTLVISLAKSLSDLTVQDYILYTNNFFMNKLLAKSLIQLDIKIMKTTQVKALDFSSELDVKNVPPFFKILYYFHNIVSILNIILKNNNKNNYIYLLNFLQLYF